MNVSNLFDYCLDTDETQNKAIYFIGEALGNSLLTISIDNTTDKIYTYSNDWLYLIKGYYPNQGPYWDIVSCYHNIITNKHLNCSYADYNVIPFVTSFSKGTVHGYAGLFSVLTQYVDNYDIYKDYKILVYLDSQQGLLDIINHFVDKKIINKEQIIYISSHVQYLFNSIKFIPVKWHVCPYPDPNFNLDLINKYIIKENYELPFKNDKFCVIKSSISQNVTPIGMVNQETIDAFCSKNNLICLEPSKMNEIEFINVLNKCKIYVTSWATTFFKNFVYVSDKCEKIIVMVIGDAYIGEYNIHVHHNVLPTKYKNASISYHIVNTDLNNIILPDIM
jgi:hypothetical protein